MKRPPLADAKVRFVGEAVAVVVGRDRYASEDGAAAIRLDIEPLEPVLDPLRGGEAGAPRLFDATGNVANVREVGAPVDDVVATAPVVVTGRYRLERVVPSSLEAHGIVVIPRGAGLEVWCSHQAPHRLRDVLARYFELDPTRIRVRSPSVGGAFGSKSQIFPEYLVVTRLALDLGRPVRWIEDRREAFVATTHGRGQYQEVTMAADESGRLLALDARIHADLGAYPHTGEFVPSMSMWVISGCYAIPRIHATCTAVVTNKTPTASYRGAGRPEAAFAVERTMDLLAREVGVDPAELRRRNFIPPTAFPYTTATGAEYDSGRYEDALDMALELARYAEMRAEQARRRASGGPPLGIGICSYVERSGGQRGSQEFGAVEIDAQGRIRARSGTASQGQGHQTALSQVVAAALEVARDRIEVVQGDTDEVPSGTGTFGSRSIQIGGGALFEAARRVIREAEERATGMLGSAAADVTYSGGCFRAAGDEVSLEEVARAAGGLSADVQFAPPQAFPFGAHVAVVEIDPETGRVHVLRLAAVDDCGVLVNPVLVRGQAIGSVAQGLGQALFEDVDYSDGGLPTATSFFTYALPTAAVVPEIIHGESVTPNPNVALGTKGAGESGCIATPPAVVNAIADALQIPAEEGLEMPLLPEKVWHAMRGEPRRPQ